MNTLQTLDRGVRALFVVAEKPGGLTIAEIAAELGIARAICYRLVATLQEHGLVARDALGRIHLGASLPMLSAQYWPSFLSLVTPTLQELADRTNATGFVSVAERDEAVVVLSLDPSKTSVLGIRYRVGSRHPLNQGAAGIALLAGRPAAPNDLPAVVAARQEGYTITRGELQTGAVGVAAPIPRPNGSTTGPEACIGIVALEDFDAAPTGGLIVEFARRVSGVSAERSR